MIFQKREPLQHWSEKRETTTKEITQFSLSSAKREQNYKMSKILFFYSKY